MNKNLIKEIYKFISDKGLPVVGTADAEVLNQKAPAGFRPKDMLADAKTVLIIAKPLPRSVFMTPKNNMFYSFYTSSYSSYYQTTNDVSNNVCLMLEKAGFPSLPIPSYSPLRFHEGEPRGLISLKHFAVEAGVGIMGKNTLLINPDHGNRLRFGGLMTTMELPIDGPKAFPKLCPPKCNLCIKACSVSALTEEGIDKITCMGNCVKHSMMPPKWFLPYLKSGLSRNNFLTRLMELFTLSFFENYAIGCFACLKVCPQFKI